MYVDVLLLFRMTCELHHLRRSLSGSKKIMHSTGKDKIHGKFQIR